MAESRKVRRFVWILSLTLGPIAGYILLLTLPEIANIEAFKNNIFELLETIIICYLVLCSYGSGIGLANSLSNMVHLSNQV